MYSLANTLLRHGALIKLLLKRGATTRSELSSLTGVNQSTVTRWINELIESELAKEVGTEKHSVGAGRRRVLVDLSHKGAYVLALHITKSFIETGLVTLRGEVAFSQTLEQPIQEQYYSERLIKEAIAGLLAKAGTLGIPDYKLLGIGVAASGRVEADKGLVSLVTADNSKQVPVRDIITSVVPLPVEMETNAWAIAMGERWYGSSKMNFLLIHVHEGVGAAVVFQGCLHRGGGQAGEIGCVKVAADKICAVRHDKVCASCEERGCLDNTVTCQAILHEVAAYGDYANIGEVIMAADHNSDVKKVLLTSAEAVATACAPMVDLMDPNALILSGPLFQVPEVPLHIREILTKISYAGRRSNLEVFSTSLGPHAGVIGAASLIFSKALGNEIKLQVGKGWGHAVSQIPPWCTLTHV